MKTIGTGRKTKAVTLRLTEEDYASLTVAARRATTTPARLARLLVLYALNKFQHGDPDLDRAIRGSRDTGIKPATKGRPRS